VNSGEWVSKEDMNVFSTDFELLLLKSNTKGKNELTKGGVCQKAEMCQ
jgi:hypothetical protein